MAEISVNQDSIIRVMPEVLANKIAAGEVVRRPSSVVKELIENAIDAGAHTVTVNIKGAGSELVQVLDDGCGMSSEDAEQSFVRHATSKIRALEDLDSIHTLGFRGEALASIGAVARVTLRSRRTSDDAGCEVVVDGGNRLQPRPIGMNPGTSVSVQNLFFNVPARRKFLKRPATELKHVVDTVQIMAISNPTVGFRLLSDDNELLLVRITPELPFLEALKKRLIALLPVDDASQLLECTESTSYLSVTGFLGSPRTHRRQRGRQFLFVNGRSVRHRYLEHAILSSYEYLIPEGTWPPFALFLTIDPRHVDVNVHPTKNEVKFDDEQGVYGMLRSMAKKALGSAIPIPDFKDAVSAEGFSVDFVKTDLGRSGQISGTTGDTGGGGWPLHAGDSSTAEELWGVAANPGHRVNTRPGDISAFLYSDERPKDASPSQLIPEHEDLAQRLLWQLHDAYVLTQIRSGLIIVDQQAAHERVVYEKALHSLEQGFGLSQQLLFPQSVDLSPADHVLLQDLLPDLKSLGFDIEPFGGTTVVVRGVPAENLSGDERTLLNDVLDQFRENSGSDSLSMRENLARSIAKRSAVRAGTRLSHKEMRALIDQLFQCESPFISPCGRSTIIQLSVDELKKRFARKR